MTREDLVQLLKDYKENRAKLKIKLKELKNTRYLLKYDDFDTSITGGFGVNQDIHSKNKVGNKVLDRIVKNDDEREKAKKKIPELEKKVRELRAKVEEVEDRLDALKYKEKELLVAYYIDGRTYEDIGTNVYFRLFSQTRDKESIKKIVEKATNKMLDL